MVYLDWAAAAPRDRDIWDEARAVDNEAFANPSSPHRLGRRAADRIEEAHARTAATVGVRSDEIVFTSGATESNNMVISSLLIRETRGNVVASAIEHASVFEPCKLLERCGFPLRLVKCGRDGRIDPDSVVRKVDSETLLLTIMHVNNETGSIQPLADIVSAVRACRRSGRRIHIHADLVQSTGRIHNPLPKVDLDSASISGHKLGAPRGCGVLVLRRTIEAIYRGGGHESGRRPGTHNLFAVWATMRALEKTVPAGVSSGARAAHDALLRELAHVPGCVVIPDTAHRSPYICSLSLPPIPGEVIVRLLDEEGYTISTGAACATNRRRDNRVLRAMGYDERLAGSAVRVSWGPDITVDTVVGFARAVARVFSAVKHRTFR